MTKARTNADNASADIQGVTAGTGLSGGGTSGTVTLTNDMATTINAAGDLLYGTANDAYTRLGIGTAGQYLSVNSGATAPEWTTLSAGGMTLLSTTSLSGATTTISSIPTTYNSLFAIIYGVNPVNTSTRLRCAPNGTTTISQTAGNDAGTWGTSTGSYIFISPNPTGGWGMLSGNSNNCFTLKIDNYASSTNYKTFISYGTFYEDDTILRASLQAGGIATNTAITSLVFSMDTNNLNGGTVVLYGVK